MSIFTFLTPESILYVNTENSKNPGQNNIPVELLEARTDSVEIRKILRNFISQKISKGLTKKHELDKTSEKLFVKKQRLDQTPELNKMLLDKSEQKTNISVADNNIKLCKNDDSNNSDSTDPLQCHQILKNVEIYNTETSSGILNLTICQIMKQCYMMVFYQTMQLY